MDQKVFKSFRPPMSLSLVLFLLACLFATLGTWQQKRASEKKVLEQQHQTAMPLSLESALEKEQRFSSVNVGGRYDTDRHILLDNQIWQGRAGVYVFTPFFTNQGKTLLVNRGWLPLVADRKTMPAIPTPEHGIVLTGMLNKPPVPGRMLGAADQVQKEKWPQLVTYLNLSNISSSLDVPLEDWVIQLSESDPDGFEGRDWKPVFLSSSRHKGYAFQWFALVAACIVMWIYIGFRKPSGNRK